MFIYKLRKKLAAAGAGEVIGTVWGRGYTVRDQVPQPTPSVMLGRLMPTMPEQTLAMLPCATSAMNAVALGG